MVGGPSNWATSGTVLFPYFPFMAHYQYIGDGHTTVRLSHGAEKVKVAHGEIVESDLPEKLFTPNNFRVYNGDIPAKKLVSAETGKDDGNDNGLADGAVKSIDELTVPQLKEVAAKYKINIDGVTRKADIIAVLSEALSPEQVAEIIADANKTE